MSTEETLPARREQALVAPVGHHPMGDVPELPTRDADPYAGIGQSTFTDDMRAKLLARVAPEMLDVLPTGEVYMPQVHYRGLLNAVFGPGGWGMMPLGGPIQDGKTISREFALVVGGKAIASAYGEQDFYPNGRMSRPTALEAAKSNALMRCCKDLGIAAECWDKRFTQEFQATFCQRVYVRDGNGKATPQWRRKDATKLRGESGHYEEGERSTGGAITKPRRTTDPAPEPGTDAPTQEDLALERTLQASLDATAPPDTPWPEEQRASREERAATYGGGIRSPGPFIADQDRRKMLGLCREMHVEVGELGKAKPGTLRAELIRRGWSGHLNEVPEEHVQSILTWIEAR